MGNCFGFLKKYSQNFYESKTDTYYYNSNYASSVPIGTPIYFDMSNNPYTQNLNNPNNLNNPYIQNLNNPNNPNVIVINQQPYYDNGLGAANGFFTGMLMGELLSDNCL